MTYSSIIVGAASYLPEKILTNHDLSQMVDTSDEWILDRTGIEKRHIAADNQLTSDLATQACLKLLAQTNTFPQDIDMIVLATTTPDDTFPATAVTVQHKIGAKNAFAFDIQAVCSGFIYALSVADNFIRSGQVKKAIVIGAETMSRIMDWTDRNTCVLFGDGAGAVLLESTTTIQNSHTNRGILSTHLYSDGSYRDILCTTGGPSRGDIVGKIHMNGRDVFRHAIEKLGASIQTALNAHNLTANDIDWFVPHQANKRIITTLGERFNLPANKVVMTVGQHANTSAASIPLALSDAVEKKLIQPGQLVLLEAIGGGLSWGSALIRW